MGSFRLMLKACTCAFKSAPVLVSMFGIALAVFISTCPATAGDLFASEVERWGMHEIALQSSKKYSNPFKDVSLRCRAQSGDTELEVEGFYDGGNTWKVRIMPTVEGRWTFETESNDPELNGKKGSFQSTAPGPGNHGPIVIRNKYHFAYADGTPFFPLGTTLYNWIHREGELQRRTLATLKKGPFNKVRFCVFPLWYQFIHVEPPLYPYVQTAENEFDFDRFNPEYFRHSERRLRDLQALGIEADVILFHPYDKWGYSKMDRAHDDAYLHYVIARLAAFRNVWWTMANEWDFVKPQKDWDHIFRMVQKLDPYDHLRANHNGLVWYDHSKPWVTHCNIQNQFGDLYSVALGARMKYGKPILIDEYGYEGNSGHIWGNLSGYEEVRRHWDATMAGAYGSHGETYVHPGDILWWAVGGELVGESPPRLGFLKRVMSEAPYEEMEPLPESVNGGMALGKKGEYYLFYFTQIGRREEAEIEVHGEGPFGVELIDPWLMTIYPLGNVEAGRHSFRTKFIPSLLRLKRSGKRASEAATSIEKLLKNWESSK